jgi:hypothetical protein
VPRASALTPSMLGARNSKNTFVLCRRPSAL